MIIMYRLVFLLVLYGQTFAVLKDIYILGLFPMQGEWRDGLAVKPAAEITIDYVNRDPSILPGYRLVMIGNDTKCNPGVAVKMIGDLYCNGPMLHMILGCGCSSVSEVLAQAENFLNVVQVSYASRSPTLSDMHMYPSFFRLLNSLSQDNYPRIALLKHFNWTRVITINHSKRLFSGLIRHMEAIMVKKGIQIMEMYHFSYSPREAVHQLKEADARIIIGAFFEDKARQLFCEAFKIRFGGWMIVWVLPGFFRENWWNVNDTKCTSNEILWATGNYFTTDVFFETSGNERDDNGITQHQFMTDYRKKTNNKKLPGYKILLSGYDAVWVIARALNATIADLKNTGYRIENFSYTDNYMGAIFRYNTRKVNFNSISGRVRFDENGDPERKTKIQHFQDGKLVTVAVFDKLDVGNELNWNTSTPIVWENGMVPKDSYEIVLLPDLLSTSLYIIMCVFASLGIFLALSFLAFNIKFRNERIISMSSPSINNLILLGCIVIYSFVFIHGYDIRALPSLCQIRVYFLVIALSLVFGGLFVKICRVYFVLIKAQTLQKWFLKDINLLITVGIITTFSLSIVVLWSITSPSFAWEVQQDDSKVVDPANNRLTITVVWICKSKLIHQEYFVIVIVCFQTIFLLFGIFMTFTTRKITILAQNDFRATGLCIYNLTVMVILALALNVLLKDKFNVKYGILCVLIIVSGTTTQCLLFIPKVYALKKYLKKAESTYPSASAVRELNGPNTPLNSVKTSIDSI